MEARVQYFDCLCRTCMNKVEASSHVGTTKPQHQWLSIFDIFAEFGALRIAELLSDAVPQIVVQPSDELPKKICTECLQQLLSVFRFQQMCLQSEKEMHELLSKEQTVMKTPMLEESIKGATETNDADLQSLKDLACSSTLQNLQQPSVQEPLAEVTVQTIEPEAAESSADDHLQDNTQLLEQCIDGQGEFEEFIKNEPIEDDAANSEYSDDDTMYSIISVTKDEVLPIELEDQQVNDATLPVQHTTYAGYKPYECPYCPLRFRSKTLVSKHKVVHEGAAKRHECDICGKKFREKSNLTKHKRIHSNEKPHKCDFCEKRFTQMQELKIHIRKHTGEKPYKCKYCERAFAERGTLYYHLRSHLGKNMHRCKFCPLAFPSSAEMRLHLTSHKNEDPEVREQNLKALQEEEAKLVLKFSKEKSKGQATNEQQQQKLSNKEIEQQSTDILAVQRTTHADKPYQCPYSPRRFNSIGSASRHKAVVHEGAAKQYECDICGKKWRHQSTLKIHKLIHCKEKPYKCDFCEKRFARMDKLKVHTRTHTGEKPYKCKYCEREFAERSILNNHLRRHLGKNIHRCKFCPLAFPSSAERRLHLTSHKNEDPDVRERNLKALQEEEAKLVLKFSKEKSKGESTEEQQQQKLSIKEIEQPSTEFAQMGKLKVHTRTHTGEKPFKCKYCERGFATSAGLNYHLRSHLGENIHRCKFCTLVFSSSAEMRLHLITHKNEDPKVRERNLKDIQEEEAKLKLNSSKEISKGQSTEELQQEKLCNKEIEQSPTGVLGEQRPTYAEDKPYECPYCPLRFRLKTNASIHKTIHEGIKQHQCSICGKKFQIKSNLSKHKRVHSKEKPYKCDFCEKRFTHMEYLKVHTRTHTGEKPYKCKYCECGFATSTALGNHLPRHLGINIHRCKFCPLAFSSSAEMRLHLITHKNEDPKVRERNLKALQEEEAKLVLKFAKDRSKGESTEEQQQQKVSNKEIEQPPTEYLRERNLKALQEEEAKLVLKFSKEKSKGESTEEQQQQKLSIKEIEQPSTDVLGEQRTTYAEDKPYECPYCPIRFSTKRSASRHKTIHEGIKPHECSICGKKFRLKTVLMTHKRIHSKEKPYKCDQCEKRFTQMEQLKVHTRTHTGEKPFKCGFAASTPLSNHLRRHVGLNIHRCKFCPLAFSSSAEMRLHLITHKNEDPKVFERNLKALQEEEAKLVLKFSKEKGKGESAEEQQQQKLSNKEIEQLPTGRDEFEEFIKNEPIEDDKFSSIAMRPLWFQQSL